MSDDPQTIRTAPCIVCGTSDTMPAFVTEEVFEEAEITQDNLHWLCDSHLETVIGKTDYHVRELPILRSSDTTLSYQREYFEGPGGDDWCVLYSPDDEDRWIEFRPADEVELSDIDKPED